MTGIAFLHTWRHRYPATALLLTLYLGLFAAMTIFQGGLHNHGGVLGFWSLNGKTLVTFGAIDANRIRDGGQYWRLLTATFLHASVPHLLVNGLALFQIGRAVEEWYAGAVLVGLHLGLGTVSNVASLWYHGDRDPDQGSFIQVGGSGALFGIIGFLTCFSWHTRAEDNGRFFRALVLVLAIGLAVGYQLGADDAAHAGGALAGGILGLLERFLRRERKSTRWEKGLALANLVALATVFGFATVAWRVQSIKAATQRRERAERVRQRAESLQRRLVELGRKDLASIFSALERDPHALAPIDVRERLVVALESIAARLRPNETKRLLTECISLLADKTDERFLEPENLQRFSDLTKRYRQSQPARQADQPRRIPPTP